MKQGTGTHHRCGMLTVHTEPPIDVLVDEVGAPGPQAPDDTARRQPSHPGTGRKPAQQQPTAWSTSRHRFEQTPEAPLLAP